MDNKLSILLNIPGFSGLSENQLKAIKQILVDRHFNKGEMIFSEGDEGDGFYVVAKGREIKLLDRSNLKDLAEHGKL